MGFPIRTNMGSSFFTGATIMPTGNVGKQIGGGEGGCLAKPCGSKHPDNFNCYDELNPDSGCGCNNKASGSCIKGGGSARVYSDKEILDDMKKRGIRPTGVAARQTGVGSPTQKPTCPCAGDECRWSGDRVTGWYSTGCCKGCKCKGGVCGFNGSGRTGGIRGFLNAKGRKRPPHPALNPTTLPYDPYGAKQTGGACPPHQYPCPTGCCDAISPAPARQTGVGSPTQKPTCPCAGDECRWSGDRVTGWYSTGCCKGCKCKGGVCGFNGNPITYSNFRGRAGRITATSGFPTNPTNRPAGGLCKVEGRRCGTRYPNQMGCPENCGCVNEECTGDSRKLASALNSCRQMNFGGYSQPFGDTSQVNDYLMYTGGSSRNLVRSRR